jgi:hypothetical protein
MKCAPDEFGRARHSVRAVRALTIRTSHSARGAQRTARPTFPSWRRASVSVRSAHGFARPQKVTSHDSAVGGRGKLVLYHHQLCAAGQEPALPRRNWRCRARRHEIQPRAIRLALPPLSAYAGSSARDYCVPAQTGYANDHRELEEVRRRKTRRGLATRFFDHRLRDHHELEEKTSYVLMNPVRKGLCERKEDWAWVYRSNDRPPPLLG